MSLRARDPLMIALAMTVLHYPQLMRGGRRRLKLHLRKNPRARRYRLWIEDGMPLVTGTVLWFSERDPRP
jgi:hypothetical protein